MDIKIGIAAHKDYQMPEDSIYLPIQVGASGKPNLLSAKGMVRDDSGENISDRNPSFCELTGLYWMWKNLDCSYCGLAHYRRHFVNPGTLFRKIHPYRHVLDRRHLEPMLEDCDIILPSKRHYYIENIASHYAHSHYPEHIEEARAIIAQLCPEYLESFDFVMQRTSAHMFNMMIMGKEKFDAYCGWMFPIIFELQRRFDGQNYDAFQNRYPGRISELLLDVWLHKNQYPYREVPVMMMGRVHWGRKIWSFIAAKFWGRRYKQGF